MDYKNIFLQKYFLHLPIFFTLSIDSESQNGQFFNGMHIYIFLYDTRIKTARKKLRK